MNPQVLFESDQSVGSGTSREINSKSNFELVRLRIDTNQFN